MDIAQLNTQGAQKDGLHFVDYPFEVPEQYILDTEMTLDLLKEFDEQLRQPFLPVGAEQDAALGEDVCAICLGEAADMPCVRATNSGVRPSGAMTTNSVTKAVITNWTSIRLSSSAMSVR